MQLHNDISNSEPITTDLDFLWLELTTWCNLSCIHCYAESSPNKPRAGNLTALDYHRIIDETADIGCQSIQFTGGEPTASPNLIEFITHAAKRGFRYIEVFTNSTLLSEKILSKFALFNVAIATSMYSNKSIVHDAITRKAGSHKATTRAIENVLQLGLKLRLSIVQMELNKNDIRATIAYLHSLGVTHIGIDRVRGIGRGANLLKPARNNTISELCGKCWQSRICVTPDGNVSPCIMSRNFLAGSIRQKSIKEIATSYELEWIRQQIFEAKSL